MATTWYIGSPIISREDLYHNLLVLWIGSGIMISLYHNQWFVGELTLLLIFGRFGFFTRSLRGGYVLASYLIVFFLDYF